MHGNSNIKLVLTISLYIFSFSRCVIFIMSVRLSACNSSAPTGHIAMKFDIGHFYEYLSNKRKFG